MPRKLATPVLAESPSSMTTELSAAEGMVGRKRTPRRGGDESSSSWTASWRTNRGLTASNWAFPLWAVHSKGVSTYMLIFWVCHLPMIEGRGVLLPALDRDNRNVEVLAVVAEAEESLRELDKFESCDVFRVISQAECRLRP